MTNLIREVRLAVRALALRPGFTIVAVATLALGIGANVALFAVVNAILIRPLPFPESDRVVVIRHHAPGIDLPNLNNSSGTIRLYRENAQPFSALAAYTNAQRNLTGGEEPARIRLLQVTADFFDVLSVQPRLGRPFTSADTQREAAPVAILTHAGWSGRFGSDPGVTGRTVELDGVPTQIVGVLPPSFSSWAPETAALVPLYVDPAGDFGTFGLELVARLNTGAELESARGHVRDLQARLPEMFGDLTPEFLDEIGWSTSVERLRDIMTRNVRSPLWIVLGTVGFVLLIACANVANLFLVRAEARRKETAIRAALGASRRRLTAGFLSESITLGIAGGALGVLLAALGIDLLVSKGAVDLPRLSEVHLDATVLAFSGILSLLVGLAFGFLPLTRAFPGSVAGGLAGAGRRTTAGPETHRTRDALVAGQLAIAVVLLVGSGLVLRSFTRLRAVEPGFDAEGILLVGLSYGSGSDLAEASRFYRQVKDRVATLPGVEKVGVTSGFPFSEGSVNGGSFYIESRPRGEDEIPPVTMYKPVCHDYFEALRMPLLEGRTMQASDGEERRALVWVNQTFANAFLDGEAIGERIRFEEPEEGQEEQEEEDWARITGVVGDVREFGLDEEVRPMVYLPLIVGNWGYPELDRMYLTIRSDRDLAGLAPSVRRVVREVDPRVPVLASRTLEEALARSMADMAYTMVLIVVAASVALLLGAVGLFGVVSYVVGQRTREIGIRVALGARGEDVVGLFLRQALRVTAVGAVLGLGGAFALSRVMRAILFEVSATDPFTFVAAPVLLVGVALFATWLPARRATLVDPLRALDSE